MLLELVTSSRLVFDVVYTLTVTLWFLVCLFVLYPWLFYTEEERWRHAINMASLRIEQSAGIHSNALSYHTMYLGTAFTMFFGPNLLWYFLVSPTEVTTTPIESCDAPNFLALACMAVVGFQNLIAISGLNSNDPWPTHTIVACFSSLIVGYLTRRIISYIVGITLTAAIGVGLYSWLST